MDIMLSLPPNNLPRELWEKIMYFTSPFMRYTSMILVSKFFEETITKLFSKETDDPYIASIFCKYDLQLFVKRKMPSIELTPMEKYWICFMFDMSEGNDCYVTRHFKMDPFKVPGRIYELWYYVVRVFFGDVDEFDFFLDEHYDDMEMLPTIYLVFYAAVMSGNLAFIQKMYNKVRLPQYVLMYSLEFAVVRGYLKVFKYLESKGVNFLQVYDDYSTLHLASRNGKICIVEYIISKGVDVNSKNEKSCTSLMYACVRGHANIVQLLINHGADVNLANRSKYSPLMYASDRGYGNIIQILFDCGVDLNFLDDKGNSALFFASKSGHEDCVTLLLKLGALVNHAGTGGTPLVYACVKGHLGVVKILLENNAEIDGRPTTKWTPLLAACENGFLDIAKYLISKKCDITRTDRINRNALHIACTKGTNPQLVGYLTTVISIESTDDNGNTPLMTACKNGCLKIVKMLLIKGADFNRENTEKKTASQLASENRHSEIVQYLENHSTKHTNNPSCHTHLPNTNLSL